MQISTKDWKNYIAKLSKLNATAAEKMQQYIAKNGFADTEAIIDYAYGLVTKYGEGSAALSAQMFETVAEMEGAVIQPAVMAQTASRNEVAKMVNGIMKQTQNENVIANAVGRKVKQAGADTTLQNALRYGAEFAWIPSGDTCGFCIMLASQGWVKASRKAVRNGHAEHIHSNCDCTYAIRFDKNTNVSGYEPDEYLELYEDAKEKAMEEFEDGLTEDLKPVNYLRRQQYKLNAEKIREQHRQAYAKRKAIESSQDNDKMKLRINYFSKSDALYFEAFSVDEIEGFEDLCGHGNSSQFEAYYDGEKHILNAKQLAEHLRETGKFHGQDIRLASCSTGQGDNSFAQQLSKELGNRVLAPSDDIYYAPDEGTLFVGSPYGNIGSWRLFKNGVEIEWKQ